MASEKAPLQLGLLLGGSVLLGACWLRRLRGVLAGCTGRAYGAKPSSSINPKLYTLKTPVALNPKL